MSKPAKYLHSTHYSAVITMRVSVIRTLNSVSLYLKLARRMNTPKLHLVVNAQKIQNLAFLQKLISWFLFLKTGIRQVNTNFKKMRVYLLPF